MCAWTRLIARLGGAMVAIWMSVCGAAAAADGVVVLDKAHFMLDERATPPADDAGWATVDLPDNWSETRLDAQGIGWYRMDFDLPSVPAAAQALLIRRLSMNGEIFLNGVRLMSGGRMAPPVTHHWNTPFFVELPAPLLLAGRNTVDVRLFAYRNSNGGLGRVHVGDAESLRSAYLTVNALHVKGSVVSFAVAMVAAFIGFAAWWRMGRDGLYGLFGLAMACWAVRYANYFVQEVPLDRDVYALVTNSAQGWFFAFFTPFLLRLTGPPRPWVERGLLAAAVLGTVTIWAAFHGWVSLKVVVGVWAFVWIPGALVLLALSAHHAWRARSARSALVLVVVWLYVPLTLRELLITSNLMPFDASYVAHYVGVPLALLIAWMLVERVVDAGRKAAMAEVARAQAALHERQRLTQDMHDGLGLQLNAALRVLERGEADKARIGSTLRACLDELRLIVDSSAADGGALLPLLASLRIRLQPRLEAAGLRVDWRMEAFPPELTLPPEASLQVLRIVQEAINNTLKHSGARSIGLEASQTTDGPVVLTVRDDGQGFDTTAGTVGKGLAGMQRRAVSAGVGLSVTSTGEGTCIRIELPHRLAATEKRLAPRAFAT